MNKEDTKDDIEWALSNWKCVAEGSVTGEEFRPQEAAYWLYRYVGSGRRFGFEPSAEVVVILGDSETQELVLQYLEHVDFYRHVYEVLTGDEDKLNEFEVTEFDLLHNRDALDCVERELWKNLPPCVEGCPACDPFRLRLLSVSTQHARADGIMQAVMGRFAEFADEFESRKAKYLPGTVTEVNEWWFFDLLAFARGEKTIEDFTYGCTDAVRFPEWVMADYIGDSMDTSTKAAMEAHLLVCKHCREVVECDKDVADSM